MKVYLNLNQTVIISLLLIHQVYSFATFLQMHKGQNHHRRKSSLKETGKAHTRHKRQADCGKDNTKPNITLVINGDINVVNKINLSNCSALFPMGAPNKAKSESTTQCTTACTLKKAEDSCSSSCPHPAQCRAGLIDTEKPYEPESSTCFTMVVVGYNISVIDSSTETLLEESNITLANISDFSGRDSAKSNGVDDSTSNGENVNENSSQKITKNFIKINKTVKVQHPLCATCGGKNKTTPNPNSQDAKSPKLSSSIEDDEDIEMDEPKRLTNFRHTKMNSESFTGVRNGKNKLLPDKSNKYSKLRDEKSSKREYSSIKSSNEYFNNFKNDELSKLAMSKNEYGVDKGYHIYPRRLENVLGYYRSKDDFLDGTDDRNDLDDTDAIIRELSNLKQNSTNTNIINLGKTK